MTKPSFRISLIIWNIINIIGLAFGPTVALWPALPLYFMPHLAKFSLLVAATYFYQVWAIFYMASHVLFCLKLFRNTILHTLFLLNYTTNFSGQVTYFPKLPVVSNF